MCQIFRVTKTLVVFQFSLNQGCAHLQRRFNNETKKKQQQKIK